jgi:hypothetical protein
MSARRREKPTLPRMAYRVEEVRAMAQVDRKTIERAMKAGRLPFVRLDTVILIEAGVARDFVREYIEARENGPTQLYRHYDDAGVLLYVGISLSTILRLSQHKTDSAWFGRISTIKIEHFATRRDAIAAEVRAVRDERPLHNIVFAAPE